MSFEPGIRINVARNYRSGRIGHISGVVVERDAGYGLVIRDDRDGHRHHLATDIAALAAYGITQTITAV